jgi:drug/metabolite transporter (DMT)-like permease
MLGIASSQSQGITLALFTAVMWALSPMCFASAGRRIGSFPVVLLRTLLAAGLLLLVLPVYVLVSGAHVVAPTPTQFFWLAMSGLSGMVVGDALLYESLVLIGPRRTTQIQTVSPLGALIPGRLLLGETLGPWTMLGVALVLVATSYAVLSRTRAEDAGREPGRVSSLGVTIAIIGALCVGLGAVAIRYAYQNGPPMDGVVATTVRVGCSAIMLWIVPLVRGQVGEYLRHLRDPFIRSRVLPGTLVGPVLGMLTYLFALRCMQAGLVSTLAAMSPLVILPIIAVRYRVRLRLDVVIAAALAVVGVGLISHR